MVNATARRAEGEGERQQAGGRQRAGGRGSRAEDRHPSGDERFAIIDKALTKGRYGQDHLIEVLHVAQDVFGYLSHDVLYYLATELRLPPSMVFGVATFYHLFSFEPPGAHTCTVCTGTACFVKGADGIVGRLQQTYAVAAGATTADGNFTLTTARCLGSCGMAPVVVIDGNVRGYQTPDSALHSVEEVLAEPAGGDRAGGDIASGETTEHALEG